MTDLRPCPFCKSQTRVDKYSRRIGKATPHIFQTAQIKCKRKSCGMSGPLFKGEGCRDRCVKHWNSCAVARVDRLEADHDRLLHALRDALIRLPDGPWEVWTSNSFRRISCHGDGDVLCGIIQRSDGHPDLSMDEKQLQALCDVVNASRAALGDSQ